MNLADQDPLGLGFNNPEEHKPEMAYQSDPKERLKLFQNWVCAYFQHEDMNSCELDFNASGPHKHTFEDISQEEHDAMIDMHPYTGSDLGILQVLSSQP